MDPSAPLVDLGAVAQDARAGKALRAAQGLKASADPKVLRQAAEDFEAMALAQMLAPMFETLSSGGLFGGGPGEDVYRSLLVEEYGRSIARTGGVGIADQVERELLQIQEALNQELPKP